MKPPSFPFEAIPEMPDHVVRALREFHAGFRNYTGILKPHYTECIGAIRRISKSCLIAALFKKLISNLSERGISEDIVYNFVSDVVFQSIYNNHEFKNADSRTGEAISAQIDDAVDALKQASNRIISALHPRLYRDIVRSSISWRDGVIYDYILPEVSQILSAPVYIPIYAPTQSFDEDPSQIGSLKVSLSMRSMMGINNAMIVSLEAASKKFKERGRRGIGSTARHYAVFSLNDRFIYNDLDFDDQSYRSIKNGIICELINLTFGFNRGASGELTVEQVRNLIYRSKRRT